MLKLLRKDKLIRTRRRGENMVPNLGEMFSFINGSDFYETHNICVIYRSEFIWDGIEIYSWFHRS